MWMVVLGYFAFLTVGVIIGYWARDDEVRRERRKIESRLRAANRK